MSLALSPCVDRVEHLLGDPEPASLHADDDVTDPRAPSTGRTLFRFVWKVAFAAFLVSTLVVTWLDGDGIGDWKVIGGILAVTIVQARSTLLRFRRSRAEVHYHDDLLFPFLLVFVGPAGAIVSMSVGTLASNLIARRAALKTTYNVGQFTFSAGIGAGVFALMESVLGSELRAVEVLTGSSVFTLTGVLLFSRLLHHLTGDRWRSLVTSELGDRARRYSAEVLLGVTAAIAIDAVPLLTPIALLTVVVVLETNGRWFWFARDRERTQDLLATTTTLHGAPTVAQVRASLVEAIRTMTGGETRFVADAERVDGVIAFEVDTGGEVPEVAVVSRPDPLDPTELAIVETLVRSAEVSMRIAAMVELYAEQSEELANLVEERESFLTGTAHQLRTPLTAILGFAHIIADDPSDVAATAEMAPHIVHEAGEMSNALDNLLIASRAVTDDLLVAPSHIELGTEVDRVVSELHLEEVVSVVGDGPAVGDPIRVRQVLRNLIRNALQHGGSEIVISVGRSDGWAYVEVADDGPGVPESEIEALFRPFTQGHKVDGQPGATGLGLHAARQLARLMQGEVTYRRERQRSVFRLELPVVRSASITPLV